MEVARNAGISVGFVPATAAFGAGGTGAALLGMVGAAIFVLVAGVAKFSLLRVGLDFLAVFVRVSLTTVASLISVAGLFLAAAPRVLALGFGGAEMSTARSASVRWWGSRLRFRMACTLAKTPDSLRMYLPPPFSSSCSPVNCSIHVPRAFSHSACASTVG